MPGGKGKSSGGKSSGGKVGADGGKKQQSHSSKAGLQVSIAQISILLQEALFRWFCEGWRFA
jgi:histone H2A